jgi:hypothetical protein
MPTQPLSQRRNADQPKGCLTLFFLLFFLVGAGVSYFVLWRPLSNLLASQSWTETECDVLSSQLATSSNSDGSTYRVDIRYTWNWNGILHEGNRHDFMIGSTSGRRGKQEVVDRYPPGARVLCWVDPRDPDAAVLSRDFSLVYLVGLVPLLFLAVGAGGLFWTLRPEPDKIRRAVSAGTGPVELRPAATPLKTFFGLTAVTLFWNGIVSVFVWQLIEGMREGHADGCLTVFLIPFVLIGLLMIFGVARQLLVLFNPRAHLTLTPGALTPGQPAFLQWRLGSGGRGVSRIRVTLLGKEETQHQSSNNTRTDRETFFTLPVVDSTQPYEISEGGSASFTLPAEAKPSFESGPDRTVWTLKVECELPRWPDTEEEYEVVVRPEGAT